MNIFSFQRYFKEGQTYKNLNYCNKMLTISGTKKIAGERRSCNRAFYIPKWSQRMKMWVRTSGFVEVFVQRHFSASNSPYFKHKSSQIYYVKKQIKHFWSYYGSYPLFLCFKLFKTSKIGKRNIFTWFWDKKIRFYFFLAKHSFPPARGK